jgi:hypothetical protein
LQVIQTLDIYRLFVLTISSIQLKKFIYDGMMCFLLFGLDLRMLGEHTIYLYKKKSSFAYVNAGFQERSNQHDE